MTDKPREKMIRHKPTVSEGKCPLCKELSNESMFPFGSDSFFCCNPICQVTRFDTDSYYIETLEPIQTPEVQYIGSGMKKKRNISSSLKK